MSMESGGEEKKNEDVVTAEKKAVNREKRDKNQEGFKIGLWFKEIMAEFGKIIWPNKKELTKMTITVIITSLLFGAIIAGLDAFFGFSFGILTEFV